MFRQAGPGEEAALEIRSLVKTKTPKLECHEYPARQEQHFRRLFAVVRAYLDALDRGSFPFRPGWTCGNCELRETACRRWRG